MKEQEAAVREMQDAKYNAFVEKFEPKKTTDDCYTPANIYDAVADFVAENYSLDRKNFRRVFWPGGDYQAETYGPDDVVVDNPPFSILSQIVGWYSSRGTRFFLFGPTLTLFSGASVACCAIPCGAAVVYENGASVNTSFVTNLEDKQVHAYPELYKAIEKANAYNESLKHKALPKYTYPDEIITAAMVARWCKYGVEYVLDRSECERIGALDAQRKTGKSIFGYGFILSERAAAERAAAERAAAERAAAEQWALSAREKNIVARLSGKPEINLDAEIEGQVGLFDILEVGT